MSQGRHILEEDSVPPTSSDDLIDASGKQPVDPKIALQLADLGNAARDRQTAHDLEDDRKVNFAQLNRTRKCNQEGTEEAAKAAVNQSKISGWNNFGGQDSSTNLESIAGGQYHRQSTAKKVQTEIRQLRIDGKEINAESIDAPRSHSTHTYGTITGNGRGGGAIGSSNRSRLQPSHESGDARSFLDPALDPGRSQRYTKGSNHGDHHRESDRVRSAGRGGRTMGRGGLAMQVGRGTSTKKPASSDDPKRTSTKMSGYAASRTALEGRAVAQGRFQERPWPPAALAGNIEPPPLMTNGGSLLKTDNTAQREKCVADIRTDDDAPAVPSPAPIDVEAVPPTPQPVLPTVQPTLSTPTLANKQALQHVDHGRGLAENFSDWYQAAKSTLAVPITDKPKPVTRPEPAPRAADDAVKISRDVFMQEFSTRRVQHSEGQRTDGRLSPVSFPGEFVSVPSTTSTIAERRNQDLLDLEIPPDERAALEQSEGHTVGSPVSSSNRASLRSSTHHDQNAVTAVFDKPNSNNTTTSPVANATAGFKFAPITSKFATPSALQNRSPNVASNGGISDAKTSSPIVFNPPSESSVGRSSDVSQPPTASLLGDGTTSCRRTSNRPNDFQSFAARSTLNDESNPYSRTTEMPIRGPSPARSILGDDTNLRLRAAAKANGKIALSQSKYARETSSRHVAGSGHASNAIKRQEAGAGYASLLDDLAKKNIALNETRRPDEPAFATVHAPTYQGLPHFGGSPYNDNISDDGEL